MAAVRSEASADGKKGTAIREEPDRKVNVSLEGGGGGF